MSFCHLTYVIEGCMYMTYGPRQRCPESRASESRSGPAATGRPTPRGCRAAGARLFHLFPAGVSLPPASAAIESARGSQRAQAGVHGEAAAHADPARAVVRICQGVVHQRRRHPGVVGPAAARAWAWLSRHRLGLARYSGNTASTVYCPRSWPRSTRCWCPTSAGPSPERGAPGPPTGWR